MKILAVDERTRSREALADALRRAVPREEIIVLDRQSELLEYMADHVAHVVLLSMDTAAQSSLALAQRLKKQYPRLNIIFVSESEQYAREAIAIHASGYLLMPVTPETIREELADLRYPVEESVALLQLQCFGNFNVLDAAGNIVSFSRSKSKELLAYLTYLHGTACTVREVAAVLFENREYDEKQQNYTQQIIAAMMRGLKKVGAERAIIRRYNSLALDVKRVDCDYYRYESKKSGGAPHYSGEFMAQYSWAEEVAGYLDRRN